MRADSALLRCPLVDAAPASADAMAAPWTGLSKVTLRECEEGGPPREATVVYTSWDAKAWRVLFVCEAAAPWATLTRRDGPLWEEEVVEVFFDPVGDGQGYFEIEINPLGTVCDLLLRRAPSGWRKEFGWDCAGLETMVRRTAHGWNAELLIPFAAVLPADVLPFAAPQSWRANFLRIARAAGPRGPRELSAWSPTLAPTFHRPECFGTVEFER